MPDRRIAKADLHAIPLLLDIVESTLHLYGDSVSVQELEQAISSVSARELSTGQVEYYVGFEDHRPFGFVGLRPLEDCGELKGPYLYRDYLGKGYGAYLLEYSIDLANTREIKLMYLLAPLEADWAISFYCRNGFEIIADSVESIRRWHDGLLAEQNIADGSLLLARLLDIEG